MDCDEFAAYWEALVAETLDDATNASMSEHARRCRDCGKKWDAHRELCTTVQSVLEDHKLSPNLADDITRKVYQEHFGTSVSIAAPPSDSALGISLRTSGMPLLLAALLGGLVGYFLAGTQSQTSLPQQIAYAQMFGARSARGGISELMLYELMGGNPVGGSGILGRGLPQVTSTVRIVFFVFLLLWLTRTKVWDAVFPSGVPGGIYVARWAALLTAILGLGCCASRAHVTLRLSTVALGSGRGQASQFLEQWLPYLGVIDQLWAIAFWLTLMVLLFTVANQLTLRFLRQPERCSGEEHRR